MKKQILKIAGVKSEKEFYKKYPTEEAFMKAHGKAFKKAQIGTYMQSEAPAPFTPIDTYGMQSDINYAVTGMTDEESRQLEALSSGSQQGQDSAQLMALVGALSESGAAKKGKKITKAQGGFQQFANTQFGFQGTPNIPTGGLPRTQIPTAQQLTAGTSPATSGLANKISATPTAMKQKVNWAKGLPVLGQVIGGIQKIKEQKRQYETAQQQTKLTDVFSQAAASRPVQQPKRKYVRPEDMEFQPEQMFPSYGVGTNVLAKDGASVGGGEIMNTFAPNTLYDDLGYEPLNESERMKQFFHGGKMHKAQSGVEQFLGSSEGQALARALGGGETGGGWGDILGGVGGLAGGPIGFAATFVGSAIDREKQKQIENQQELTAQNVNNIIGQSTGMAIQNMNSSYMQNGGTTSPYKWVSHTWQPQVITTFGEHKVKDLLKPPADADMLRAGGHLKEYTPPSAAAMSTERPNFQMGGELQTHWGGYAEPMSYNPFLPEGGETIMFRGQSHDESDGKGNTGIGITYGNNPVEVERGEPAIKMKDGSSGDSSLVVFGNLKVPKGMLPGADGKNFKKYVSKLSEKESKLNNSISKATTALDELDVLTPFDQLTFNSLQSTINGGNAKLKDIAQTKMDAAALQTAMNDTIEEFGLETTDKGTIKARKGMLVTKAQDGTKKPSKMSALAEVPKGQRSTDIAYGKVTLEDIEQMKANNPWYDWKGFNPKSKADVLKFQQAFNMLSKAIGSSAKIEEDKKLGEQTVSAKVDYGNETPVTTEKTDLPGVTITGKRKKEKVDITPYKRSGLLDVLNQALPYLRPSDAEPLSSEQLLGEMFALTNNQLEPVQAQTYQPQLSVPYDISLQDILNENEASFRSQQRLVGYNPAAQSQLNAQKYAANQRVLGEQFRMNQAMKDQIYRENRNILNDAQLKNLGILDQQYVRQAEAVSKTKATTQAALNSIASKYAQNKLENRMLQVYENMYNYRYDPKFRAVNMNPLWQPNIGTVPGVAEVPVKDANGNILYYRQQVIDDVVQASTPEPQQVDNQLLPIKNLFKKKTSKDDSIGKTGKKIDRKKALNSMIVKSMKNL